MTKIFTLFFLFFSISIFAQPANDDCAGAIDLGTAPVCNYNEYYTNVNATPSDVGPTTNLPTCLSSGNSPRDVWFKFTAGTITDYDITIVGEADSTGSTPLHIPQLVLYRGFCNQLFIMDCLEAPAGQDSVTISVTGLDPGLTYFLRVGDYSAGAPNSGTFRICVDEKSPEMTVDQIGSQECYGVLYDTGGADGDYGPDEDHVFTICPTDFHQCISLSFEYYNIEANSDEIIVYDGSDTNSPIIGDFTDLNGDPNMGGVAAQFYASSGCVTIEFISDGSTEFEGFKAIWQCTQDVCPDVVSIEVGTTVNDTTTILEYLNTPYATTVIDSIVCHEDSYRTFEAPDNSDLGLKRGILLSSGNAAEAEGPNNSGSESTSWGTNGDDDLDVISNLYGDGSASHDACVVYLDVYAYSDKLEFEYIFGSEEYNEWVDFYNDIFAFLISGPGITGDINGKKNIALIPNTTSPVQINDVNQSDNWQYFRDNEPGLSVEYDGLTSDSLGIKKSLTAKADVIPCNHYKLKLAVADRGDSAYDSAVFVGEIKSGAPEIILNFQSGLDYFVENCTDVQDSLVLQLDGEVLDTTYYVVEISGSATQGVDYILDIPDTLVFSSSQTYYAFPITIVDDNEVELVESIIISLTNNYGCGNVVFDEMFIEIKDNIEVVIAADSADVCIADGIQLEATGAVGYQWSPGGMLSDSTIASPFAMPQVSGWVNVIGFAGICSEEDSIYLNVLDVQVSALVSDAEICLGETVNLNCLTTVVGSTYSWTPTFGVSDPTAKAPTATPGTTTNYVVEIESGGCIDRDTVLVSVDTLFEPMIIPDSSICLGYGINLANPMMSTSTFAWTPSGSLDDSTSVSPLATPTDMTTVYTVVSTSANGYCSASKSVTVTTIPAELQVFSVPSMTSPDTIMLCAPETADLLAQTSTNGAGLFWLPSNGTLSSTTDTLVTASPATSSLYIATLVVDQCIMYDSVYIQIDSLPDLALEAVPAQDPYCQGQTVSLFSKNYPQASFPNITNIWSPTTNVISDPTNLNLVFTAQDTMTYTRITTNGACTDTTEFLINVETPVIITVTQDKDTICGGDPVQLEASSPTGTQYVWTPSNGLSCDDCNNPIATVYGTTTFNVSLDDVNCPSAAQATITVLPTPSVQFPADIDLCPGESIVLNEDNNPTYTYTWTSDDDTNFGTSNDAQPTATPTATSTYQVVASIGFCEITESVTVNVADDNLVIEGPNGVCPGFPITLDAVTGGNGTYLWSPDNQDGSSITVEPAVSTVYSVVYTYGDNCTLTASQNVEVYQGYTISIAADKDTVYSAETINLVAGISPSIANPNISWTQNGNGISATGASISAIAGAGPEDLFTAVLVTPEGCEYTAATSVVVLPLIYDLPNAFTPDGNGSNDVFRMAILEGYELSSFQVFNRWGQLVFETSDANKGWDGTYKSKDMPTDVYPFHVVLKAPNGDEKIVDGNVTLLR